jgi:hypothetical protein
LSQPATFDNHLTKRRKFYAYIYSSHPQGIPQNHCGAALNSFDKKREVKVMYDLLLPSELTSVVIDLPDLLALLSILLLALVGLILGLVLLDMAYSLRKHPRGGMKCQ